MTFLATCSCSLEIPVVMALLGRDGAAAVNTPPSTKHKAPLPLSSRIYSSLILSDGIFVFRFVFSSVLEGMCVLGP